jgi:outer membrane autotransporter protein
MKRPPDFKLDSNESPRISTMKRQRFGKTQNAGSFHGMKSIFSFLTGMAGLFLTIGAQAQTWVATTSSDWSLGTNWSPAVVPDSQSAGATLSNSTETGITLSSGVSVGSVVLASGANNFSIINLGQSFSLLGAGVVNNSTSSLAFTNLGDLNFYGGSTAGNATIDNYIQTTPTPDSGTVSFLDGSSAGHSTITNDSSLVFSGDNSVTFSTAGNATITNNNTMSFEGYSTAGNANITNTLGDPMSFGDESTAGNAMIANTGNLVFAGGSSVTLCTAGSATIDNIHNGTVSFGDNSTAGNAEITNDGFWEFSGGTTFCTAGSSRISNSSGVMEFMNDSTAANAGITNGGTLYFLNNSTAENAVIVNASGGVVSFGDASTANNSAILNQSSFYFGSDGVTFATAATATIVNDAGGILNFEGDSTAGNATITSNSGGYIFFYGQSAGGSARIINDGVEFDISSDSLGGVTVASLEGTGMVNLGANNLTTGGNNLSSVISGQIKDGGVGGGTGGSLTKVGTGTLTLSGDNSYSGGTDLTSGGLIADNDNALGSGSVSLNGGTTLGLVGGIHLNTVNYTQSAGSTLEMELGGTGANQWDELSGNGAATFTLGGNLEVVSQGHEDESYQIVSAAGGTVTGSWAVTDLIAGDSVSISYGTTVVTIETFAPSFAQLGTTTNQINIGEALDKLAVNSEDSSLITVMNAIPNASLPAAYNQISPSSLTSIYRIGFSLSQLQAGLIAQRLSQIEGDFGPGASGLSWKGNGPLFAGDLPVADEAALVKKASPDPWGVFAVGIDNFGTVSTDGNGAGYQFSTGGMTAGLDHQFGNDLAGGLLFGYSGSGTSQTTSQVTVTGGQVGLYAGWHQDKVHVNALVDGGFNNYSLNRQSAGGSATGSTQGTQFTGELGEGLDWQLDQMRVGLFASEQYTVVNINGYTETGSTPLSYASQNEGDFSSDLGVRADWNWKLGGITLSPSLSAAWEHEFQSNNIDSLNASFASAGSDGDFTVYGPALGTDAAVLGGGLNIEFAKGLNLYAQYQGKLGMTNFTSQSVLGGVNIGF